MVASTVAAGATTPDRKEPPVSPYLHDDAARGRARRLWRLLEVVHTPVYFSKDVAQASKALGLENRMQGYCAMRTFPLGPVPSEVVTSVFYGFAPRAVAFGLPAAWRATTPDAAASMVTEAVRNLYGGWFQGLEDELARAAELAREATLLHPTIGRPLAAAWASVPWGDDPVVALWQAATRIRESRGDGHIALLVAADIDGVGSHLTVKGDSPRLRERMTPLRGWADAEWDAGARALQERGLLAEDGSLTDAGQQLRTHLEAATDDLAAAPWVALGDAACERLVEALAPLVDRIVATEVLPGFVTRGLPTHGS
jgi:hypothetical protein